MGKSVESQAKELVEALRSAWPAQYGAKFRWESHPEAEALTSSPPAVRAAATLALLELRDHPEVPTRHLSKEVLAALLLSKLPFTAGQGEKLLEWIGQAKDV